MLNYLSTCFVNDIVFLFVYNDREETIRTTTVCIRKYFPKQIWMQACGIDSNDLFYSDLDRFLTMPQFSSFDMLSYN